MLKQAYKTVFNYRYLARFQVNRAEVTARSRELFVLCDTYKADLPTKDRVVFGVFERVPALYRWYRILGDRTLLAWERTEKKKRKLRSTI